ncbi:YopX family protein [Bacteroides fragilis]
MNRTIKFRGKTVNDNKWVYEDLLHIAGGCIIYHGSQKYCEITTGKHVSVELLHDEISVVVPETVGQFTGLFDKNGKEIYEGDILLVKDETDQEDPGECYEVGFKKGCFGYISKYGGELLSFCDYEIEEYIVGNISDNPELMKEEL